MIFNFLNNKFKRKFHLNNISYLPGSWIDDIYMQETKNLFGRIIREIKIRVIFFTLFPVLGVFNVISNALTSILYGVVFTLSSTPKNKTYYRDISDKAFDNVISNLFGLAFCIPIGLFYMREFSSMMVAPQSKHSARTGGSFTELNAKVFYPKSIDEVQALIKKCKNNNTKVTIRGAGASQGLQYSPAGNGIVLDLKHLDKVEPNANNNTVTVGAGATWSSIEQYLAPIGRAINVRQASSIFTVGGSLSANVHGWSHKTGTLANTVDEITIINANGDVQKLIPTDDLFGYVLGGYGMFGVIVGAKLKVIPNEKLKEKGISIPIQDYVQYYQQSESRDGVESPLNTKTRMHLYRLSLAKGQLLKSGVSVQYVAGDEDQNAADPIRVNIYNEGRRGLRFQRIMTNIARKFSWLRTLYWKMEKRRIVASKGEELTTVEYMQAPILAMLRNTRSDSEWLQEYFIPGEDLASFLDALGTLLDKNSVSLLNASVRAVPRDTITKMGYANKADMFAVVLCFNQKLDSESRLKTRRWIKEANDLTLIHNGTYYLVYQPYATKEQFRKSYPQYQQVLAKKRVVDPGNVFASEFSKYFYEEQFNPYQHVFTSEEHMHEYAVFLNKILMEVDSDKVNVLLKDILSYADTSADIFKEMHRRINEITPSLVRSKYREIQSLWALKKDLAAQAKQLMDTDKDRRAEPLNGILEVGYPGRHLPEMVPQLGIKGKIDVMQETKAITDIVQSGFPRTHSRSFNLDFTNPNLDNVEPQTYDVVTCFVGLHHFNMEALDTFLRNLNIVTRKNGNFLLMDHDVTDNNSYAMAYLAHSVFNAVKGATLQDEVTEVRDFRSISQWKTILDKYGFEMCPQPEPRMIREGDPSLNTMLRFRKIFELNEAEAGCKVATALLNIDKLKPFKPVVTIKSEANNGIVTQSVLKNDNRFLAQFNLSQRHGNERGASDFKNTASNTDNKHLTHRRSHSCSW